MATATAPISCALANLFRNHTRRVLSGPAGFAFQRLEHSPDFSDDGSNSLSDINNMSYSQPASAPAATPSVPAPYDKKTKSMIGIGITVIAILGIAIPMFFTFYPEYERDQLIKNGTAASGVITDIQPTGNIVNDQPQVKVTVKVTTENGETFESVATMIINPVYIPQFQPGKNVKVKFDPNDRSKMAIEETEDGQR
jgi:hypothetical protein